MDAVQLLVGECVTTGEKNFIKSFNTEHNIGSNLRVFSIPSLF